MGTKRRRESKRREEGGGKSGRRRTEKDVLELDVIVKDVLNVDYSDQCAARSGSCWRNLWSGLRPNRAARIW